jgi:RING-finger-containing E3 ubiquitin ligase
MCEICLEAYNLSERAPLILKECSHTFCAFCIGQLLKQHSFYIVCPNCRKKTYVKQFSDIPKNYALIKMMESSISDIKPPDKKPNNYKDFLQKKQVTI